MEIIYEKDRELVNIFAKSHLRKELNLRNFLRKASPIVLIGLLIWGMWMATAVYGYIAISHPIYIVTLH